MAFRSDSPVVLSFPPFRGVTRRLILAAAVVWLVTLVLSLVVPGVAALLVNLLVLQPAQFLHGLVWQAVTYPFLRMGLLSLALACLSLWFFGSALESERGARWLSELFFASTVGGAVLACALYGLLNDHVWGVTLLAQASGLWPFVLATMLAYSHFHPNEELNFNFIFRIKAKYLTALYLLFYLVISIVSQNRFSALLALTNSLAAFVFLRFAPRRGMRLAVSEGWYGWRNAWYRAKRRRAAKKFKVYMRKQGKDVNFDASGRYTGGNEPGTPRDPADPNSRRWMN